ncbi:hypothetical protein [Streptomyces sp. NPDC055036]
MITNTPEHRVDVMRAIGPKALTGYTGHYFQVLTGTYGYAGLLVRVDGRHAEIFQPRLRGIERFKIGDSTFIRSLDKTPRPAYARAIAHDQEWIATDISLRGGNPDGEITDPHVWDRRKGEWEESLIDIHAALMREMAAVPICDIHPVYQEE